MNSEDSLPAVGSTLPIDTFAVGEFVNVTGDIQRKRICRCDQKTRFFFPKDFTRKFCESSRHRIDGNVSRSRESI